MIKIILLLLLLSVSETQVFAQTQDLSSAPKAKNIIYGELATYLFSAWGSINYERILNDKMSFRAGIGTGANGYWTVVGGYGSTLMFNYFPVGIKHRLELGIGASATYTNSGAAAFSGLTHYYFTFLNGQEYSNPPNQPFSLNRINRWWFGPAVSLAYRYQPKYGGFFFRTGLTVVNQFGLPIQISLGYTW